MKNPVLYFNKPSQVCVLEEAIPKPKSDEILIKNIFSGISSGTEMLFYRGLMPYDLSMDEIIPALNQQLKYPFKYGYCSVGQVIETGSKPLNHLLNRFVFVFNPHEGYFCAKENHIIPIPEHIAPQDALFIPSMETAINFLLDGAPLIGENVLILGLGVIGLLTIALLQEFPLNSLLGVDLHEKRRQLALDLGADYALDAQQSNLDLQVQVHLHNHADLIYELSGNPNALNCAISCAAFEGRIVLGSWYGTKPCAVDLGGRFHRNRIQIIASQVSTIASKLQGRWTKTRRFELVFKMLTKIKPSRFISHNFSIHEAHKAYQLLDSDLQDTLFIALNYEE